MRAEIIEKLTRIVGQANAKTDLASLLIYGSDSSVHSAKADIILRPETTEQVQAIMRVANSEKIPVIARGSGSGMSGHSVPIDGGIVLDMKRMNKILEICPEDALCRVQAGVVDNDLNNALKPYGFMYPPLPASSKIATIGGEIANNASGIRSVKYGATRDSVLGLKVVLANGELINLGANTRVEASGYQLDRLIVGSEGTLAVIVEATLKFVPIPKFRCLAIAKFDKLEEAGESISDIIASGCQPSMLELMDNIAITAVNTALDMGLPDVDAILLLEADGMTK